MKDIIEKYVNTYGTRFSKKQKLKARDALVEDFNALGYSANEIKSAKGFKAKNLVFGNVKAMKSAVVVPFDTPERKMWSNLHYYPLNGNKSTTKMMIATFLPILIIYGICFFIIMFGTNIVKDVKNAMYLNAAMTLILLFLVYLVAHGISNKHNAARYSASVVASLEIARILAKNNMKQCVFIFTDKNKNKYKGSANIAQMFANLKKSPNVIFIDTIARGSQMQIGCKSHDKKAAIELSKLNEKNVNVTKMDEQQFYQTPFSVFSKLSVIACGDIDAKGNLEVLNTCSCKDTQIKEENITNVVNMVVAYVKKNA